MLLPLLLLLRLLPLLWAPQQQMEVVVHQPGRQPLEQAVGVAKLYG